jgi:hypothetical protein
VSGGHISRRQRASRVPEITGVRLAPIGGEAVLVNISASGVLVECGTRVASSTAVTVFFDGTFKQASAAGRVARCVVARIGADGLIRYHLGIAFNQMIDFDVPEPEVVLDQPPASPPPLPDAVPPAAPPEVRNRW